MIKDLLFGGADVNGEVGIEIEVEGENLPAVHNNYWRTDRDGSLKGREAYEYVLSKPVKRKSISKVLKDLQDKWKANHSKIDNSFRAGIHVHINVRDITIKHMVIFSMLYYLFEDQLLKWCGEDRIGNHFCLSSKDAEYVLFELERAIVSNSIHDLHSDNIRYSSLNYKALIEYGSLEFRGMRSTDDINLIETWVELLLSLKDYALTLNNPIQVIENLSANGIEALAKDIFKDLPIEIDEDWNDLAYAGMRRVQSIAYCIDWDTDMEKYTHIPVDFKFEEKDLIIEDDIDEIMPHNEPDRAYVKAGVAFVGGGERKIRPNRLMFE